MDIGVTYNTVWMNPILLLSVSLSPKGLMGLRQSKVALCPEGSAKLVGEFP